MHRQLHTLSEFSDGHSALFGMDDAVDRLSVNVTPSLRFYPVKLFLANHDIILFFMKGRF